MALSRRAKVKEWGICFGSLPFLFRYAPESVENCAMESHQFLIVVTYSTLNSKPAFSKPLVRRCLSHLNQKPHGYGTKSQKQKTQNRKIVWCKSSNLRISSGVCLRCGNGLFAPGRLQTMAESLAVLPRYISSSAWRSILATIPKKASQRQLCWVAGIRFPKDYVFEGLTCKMKNVSLLTRHQHLHEYVQRPLIHAILWQTVL